MTESLVVVGGFLETVGYALRAVDLRQTRRRVRAGVAPFPGYQAVDFSRTSDSAAVRPPTPDERLAAVEREVSAIARRLQTSGDEAVAERLRDEAAVALSILKGRGGSSVRESHWSGRASRCSAPA